jgi:hypothetical protein
MAAAAQHEVGPSTQDKALEVNVASLAHGTDVLARLQRGEPSWEMVPSQVAEKIKQHNLLGHRGHPGPE